MRKALAQRLLIGCAALAIALTCPVTQSAAQAPTGASFPRFEPTPENIALRDEIVRSNINFTLLHEVFHLLVWAYDLPVLGREEDAADQFAGYHITRLALSSAAGGLTNSAAKNPTIVDILTRTERIERSRDEIARTLARALVQIEGPAVYFSVLGASRPSGSASINWWDEHGIDEQRAARIRCLAFGSLYERLPALADVWKIPEESRRRCVRDAASSKQALDTLLSPWFAQLDTLNERLPPDSPLAAPQTGRQVGILKRTALKAHFLFDERASDSGEVQLIRNSPTLDVVNLVLMKYKPPPKLTTETIDISIRPCGLPNAYFSPRDHSLTLCTELIAHYREAAEVIVGRLASK